MNEIYEILLYGSEQYHKVIMQSYPRFEACRLEIAFDNFSKATYPSKEQFLELFCAILEYSYNTDMPIRRSLIEMSLDCTITYKFNDVRYVNNAKKMSTYLIRWFHSISLHFKKYNECFIQKSDIDAFFSEKYVIFAEYPKDILLHSKEYVFRTTHQGKVFYSVKTRK